MPLAICATPIGNLDDVTLRVLEELREADLVLCEDTRHTRVLLEQHGIAAKLVSYHQHNEAARTSQTLDRLRSGERVALVSDAGTPTVSDPGGLLIRAAIAAGLRVEPVPGPSAVLAALSASGLPTESFTFLGFPPVRAKDRSEWFEKLNAVRGTIVFFEAPHRIQRTLHDLERHVGDCEAVICRELTKVYEDIVRGSLSALSKIALQGRGEFTVVVSIGRKTESNQAISISPPEIAAEFGVLTNMPGLTRRKAINILGKRHGIAPNRVYEMLEESKLSVE